MFDKIIGSVDSLEGCPSLLWVSVTTEKCQDMGMTNAKYLWFESITSLQMRPLMCVNVFTSCEGALQ